MVSKRNNFHLNVAQLKRVKWLFQRYKGAYKALHQNEDHALNNLLLLIDEEQLIQWILAMEQRGFPLYLINVQ